MPLSRGVFLGAPRQSKFTHFSKSEREIIRRLLNQKCTLPHIARVLGKHRSSVFREVRRNRYQQCEYYEIHADALARRRRAKACEARRRIENILTLEGDIRRLLRFGLSPEQVAGYMKRVAHPRAVSARTVYNWIQREWQQRKALLRFRGKPRTPYGTRKDAWDPHKRHISTRPSVVARRERLGDWEGDLVHGTQNDSRQCLLTLNERRTGFCVLRKITTLSSEPVARIIAKALKGLPVHTITFDNGIEFGRHQLIERTLRCKVYFTDVNSPQQRGSNENLNGLIRQYFPKGRSLIHVTQEQVVEVARRLNARPRKRLGFKTPQVVFTEEAGRPVHFTR